MCIGCPNEISYPDYTNEQPFYYGRSILKTTNEKKAFDLIVKTLINLDASTIEDLKYETFWGATVKEVVIDFTPYKVKNIGTIARYAYDSEPRLFHIKDWGAQTIRKDSEGNVTHASFFVAPGYSQDPSKYETEMKRIDQQVDIILSEIQPEVSDSDKYEILYKFRDYPNLYGYSGHAQDIVGIFILKKAFCGGFGKAYLYLVQKAGLKGLRIKGDAGGGYHAWNYVSIDNQWYLADPTWGWYHLLVGKDAAKGHIPEQGAYSNILPELSDTNYPR